MKQLGIVACIVFGAMLIGCGGGNSSTPGTINGNWSATLTNPDNSTAFAFTTSLTETSGSSVNITNFTFTTTSPCFSSGTTETGTFTLSGDLNGNVTGTYAMTIQSGTPSGNQLTLQGTVNNNVISGTWILSGVTQGCTGSGNFTMTPTA
jgi:hypothetical protein